MLNHPKFGQITQIRDWFWLKWAPWWGISPDSYLVSLVWRQGTWRNEDLWESSIAPLAKLWRCKNDKTVICNEVTDTVDFFGSAQVEWKLYGFYLASAWTFSPLWNVSRGKKRGRWIKIQHSITRITHEHPSGHIKKTTCQKDLSPNLDLQFRRKKCSSKKCSTKPPPKEIKKGTYKQHQKSKTPIWLSVNFQPWHSSRFCRFIHDQSGNLRTLYFEETVQNSLRELAGLWKKLLEKKNRWFFLI